MKKNLIWSDPDGWQWRYFNLPEPPRRLPPGYQSAAMADAIERERRRLGHEAAVEFETREHIKALAERDEVEKWRPLVSECGAKVVTRIMRRVDPSFKLPKELEDK
jgi:hypothetical protein